ncbi:MAG: preprotein translocase subunit SecA [Akkermansia sp.]|nr:preprotein translocase subunit SecA [Akkermansia sp.]MBQ3526845.1 preprotein translocase subunit SecA [Akkermansia sp.]MBQ7024188.1 preprotein translocase subunit SecA [Akkermansia sp.]
MIKWILNKIVGSKNQREVRKLRPIVKKMLEIEKNWVGKDRDFLVGKTAEWQKYLHRFTPIDLPTRGVILSADETELKQYAETLNTRFEALKDIFPKLPEVEATAESIEAGKKAFAEIEPKFDKLRARYLEQIMPEAFAVAKCAARNLCGTEVDVCGTPIKWDMVHFDVQLIGGIALHRGFIAEMATGEGKTLVATLPVYLNALTGLGVHVVTVNDYLARRDSMWMGALFKYLGLTVGCIQSMMPNDLRRQMYACDITYGTNAEFGFDYLRDNGMATTRSAQVQRGHYFAIIDEVDSILIDEARTPLIISGPAVIEREQQYDVLKPLIEKVVKAQVELCNGLMSKAKKYAAEGDAAAAGRCLYKVKLGMPRNRAYMRSQEDVEMRRMVEKYELFLLQDPRKLELFKLKEELYFCLDEKLHDADLMEMGRELISPGKPEDFVLPDLGTEFVNIDEDETLTEREREARKTALIKKLDENAARLHTISQLLKAYTIYEKDKEYVVKDSKVIIIDQNTGREMPGRRWSEGLHQAVEAKEGVEVEAENMTYATITIQNYFRLYSRLAGMTGTAETEAAEFHDIYKLDVLPIPTNRPCIRKDLNDLIFKTRREKFNAVVAKIKELHTKGQPVLVGTASVVASETLSRMLSGARIPHEVLNAKNHQREAEIVARAGQRGAVTVSTNMAGRGTDIKLGEGVADLGGLFVLGTERYESRRIDRQLRGRCSRQGDPGASQFFLSFEDDLMRNFGGSERMTRVMDRFGMEEGEAVESGLMNKIIEGAQKRVEQRNYMWRKHVLDYDDVMNQQRTIVYGMRNEALLCEDPREMIYEQLVEGVNNKCELYLNEDNTGTVRRADLLQWVNATFPLGWGETEADFLTRSPGDAAQVIIEKVREMYEKKVAGERPDRVDQMERSIMLQAIDKLWQQHITDMDALREGVRLRAQGQRDPLVEYKREAYEIFEALMNNIQFEILNNLFRSTTNLNAFEDFLASLPGSNAEEEDADVTDILGNGDLLSLLREQMSQIAARAKAAEPAAPQLDALPEMPGITEPMDSFSPTMELPEGESVSGAPMPGVRMKAEKKLTMPRKKVMGKVKRESNPGVLAMGGEEDGEAL